MQVIAGKKITPGKEINIVYGGGVLNTDQLFQDYGFVDPVTWPFNPNLETLHPRPENRNP
jgi:hypothetical protein